MSVISQRAALAGHSDPPTPSRIVHVLPLARTSATLLRTLPSAPQQDLVATVAIPHGIGSRRPVLSLEETTPTLALVPPACHTAWHHALTMCQQLRNTRSAQAANIHLHHASGHAASLGTRPATATTRSGHLQHTV